MTNGLIVRDIAWPRLAGKGRSLLLDELLGTGSIKLEEPGTKVGLSPWLAGIYVKRACRGSGVGVQIVAALEAKARDLGVETMYLSVDNAVGFYVQLGWSILEEQIGSYGVKEVTLMSKRLTPAERISHEQCQGAFDLVDRMRAVEERVLRALSLYKTNRYLTAFRSKCGL